jgi:hypothetical protein
MCNLAHIPTRSYCNTSPDAYPTLPKSDALYLGLASRIGTGSTSLRSKSIKRRKDRLVFPTTPSSILLPGTFVVGLLDAEGRVGAAPLAAATVNPGEPAGHHGSAYHRGLSTPATSMTWPFNLLEDPGMVQPDPDPSAHTGSIPVDDGTPAVLCPQCDQSGPLDDLHEQIPFRSADHATHSVCCCFIPPFHMCGQPMFVRPSVADHGTTDVPFATTCA